LLHENSVCFRSCLDPLLSNQRRPGCRTRWWPMVRDQRRWQRPALLFPTAQWLHQSHCGWQRHLHAQRGKARRDVGRPFKV